MRQIVVDLSKITSPLKYIAKIMHQPLIRIAPEMEDAFEREYSEFAIECIQSDELILNVCVERKHVRVSTIYLEILWCFGYTHFRYYQRFVDATLDKTQTELKLNDSPDTSADFSLLTWILRKAVCRDFFFWPDECTMPQENPQEGSDHNVANEFCLGGLACLLHHELNHIRFNHVGPSQIVNEQEADSASWDWIISNGFDVSTSGGRKRLLMIVHAYLVPVILDIHMGSFPCKQHPPSFERLASALSHFDTGHDYMAHSFAYAVIHLHVSNCNNKIPMYPALVHDDQKAAFDYQINHLRRFAAGEFSS